MKDEDGNTTLCFWLCRFWCQQPFMLSQMLTTMVPADFENFFIDAGILISHDSFSPHLENIDIREILR